MKYLMLDTNIYIDMIVSRNGDHKPESYSQLLKLLNYGEIKLIVPKIVITEVFRHLNTEIEKIGKAIGDIRSKANKLYWVNHVEELERFNDNLRPVKKGINDLVDEFNASKEKYKFDYENLLNKLFKHKNSIILTENPDIIFKATQRKVHQIRPFHYNEVDKDCMPDSIIIESLINIEDLMDLNVDDTIYFISRNPADFSDDKDKNILHSDIQSSIDSRGLTDRVHYSTLFTRTLLYDFQSELENVGLIEEFEAELEQETQAMIEESYADQEDMERESAGLSSLSSDYVEKISEYDEITGLFELLQEMQNDISIKYDEYLESYSIFEEELKNKGLEELQELIEKNPIIQVIIDDCTNEDDIKDGIINFVNWQTCGNDELRLLEEFKIQDYFGLNETLATFYDINNNYYRLKTVGYLDPTNDHTDDIQIMLYKDNILIVEDYIEVYYGYITFDDDGNVDDGAEENIDVNIDRIIEKLTDIKDKIISTLDESERKVRQITEMLDF